MTETINRSLPPGTIGVAPTLNRASGWMNVFAANKDNGAVGHVFATRENADAAPAAKHRLACVQINYLEPIR